MNNILNIKQMLYISLTGIFLLMASLFITVAAWAVYPPGGPSMDQDMYGTQDSLIKDLSGSGSDGGGGGGSGGGVYEYMLNTINCYGQSPCGYSSPVQVATYAGKEVQYPDGGHGGFCVNTPDNTLVAATAGYKLIWVPGNTLGEDPSNPRPRDIWVAQRISGCGYGQWVQSETKTCFYNAISSGAYSPSLSNIVNVATSGNKKPSGLSPQSPTSERYSNCNTSYYHSVSVPTDRYGYYALHLSNQYTSWKKLDLVYGGKVYSDKWEVTGRGSQTKYGFYSFSCNTDNPYSNFTVGASLYGTYNSFASKASNTQDYLNPANCPQTKGRWECTITDASTIGLDRNAVAGRKDIDDMKVSVMRNGDPVRLTYAAVKISDYDLNGRETVLTPGATGSVVRDLRNVNYRDSVVGRGSVSGTASTPWNSKADVNSKSQYFIRKDTRGSNTTDWGQWVTTRGANENRDYNLYFNWASDPGAPFVAAREYQVTADFLVPSGASGGLNPDGSASTAGIRYEWKQDTRQCYEKTGTGGNLSETRTPVVSKTNPVDVLRSTGEN